MTATVDETETETTSSLTSKIQRDLTSAQAHLEGARSRVPDRAEFRPEDWTEVEYWQRRIRDLDRRLGNALAADRRRADHAAAQRELAERLAPELTERGVDLDARRESAYRALVTLGQAVDHALAELAGYQNALAECSVWTRQQGLTDPEGEGSRMQTPVAVMPDGQTFVSLNPGAVVGAAVAAAAEARLGRHDALTRALYGFGFVHRGVRNGVSERLPEPSGAPAPLAAHRAQVEPPTSKGGQAPFLLRGN